MDLIGWTKEQGTFLCELKHAKTQRRATGNGVDYAIFEALLYYAIVNRDHASLNEEKVYRSPEAPRFRWEAVSRSRVILVLANDYFWAKARCSPNIERIKSLVTEIRKSLEIEVLLCSTSDYTFKAKDVLGEYEPQLVPPADEKSGTDRAFPSFRLKVFSIDEE